MSYSSNFNLNQRISYLESIINQITPSLPLDLANILIQGNSAGATDIDLNNNDVLNVNNIDLTTINGSAYPPSSSTDLANVLLQGNSAGATDIDLNNNNILQVDNINLTTINGSAYPPAALSSSLFNYKAKTTSQAPPIDNGYIYWNNAVQTSATVIYVSHLDDANNDIDVLLGSLSVGYKILIQDQNNSNNYQQWKITSISVVTPNTFITFGVSLLDSTPSFSFTNNHSVLLITQSANQNLSQVLAVGNDAEGQSITNVNNINLTTINGSAYPPAATSSETIKITSDNTGGTYYIPFSKTTGTGNKSLYQDDTTTPLTYNPFLGSLTASIFSGNATSASKSASIDTTSDNTSGAYYIPFSKTTAGTSTVLYLDDTAPTPLSYNPSTSFLTATTFNGALTGNAATATDASNVLVTSDNDDFLCYIPFTKSKFTGNKALYQDDILTGLTYNPYTSFLSATTFNGALTGNAATATTATNATNVTLGLDTTSNSNFYLAFASGSGNQPLSIGGSGGTGLRYNPSTSSLFCSSFNGSVNGYSTQVILTTDDTSGSYYIPFSKTANNSTTGNTLYIDNSNTPLIYNPNTSSLSATTFSGALNGNASTSTNSTNSANVLVTSYNTSTLCYLTFTNTKVGANKALFQDDLNGLTYNPDTSFLSATTFNGTNLITASNGFAEFRGPTRFIANIISSGDILNTTFSNGCLLGTDSNGTNRYCLSGAGVTGGLKIQNFDTSSIYVNTPAYFKRDGGSVFNDVTVNGSVSVTGSFLGNATSATIATNVEVTTNDVSTNYNIPFLATGSGSRALLVDNSTFPTLTYNPSTSSLSCGIINASLVGSGAGILGSTIPVGSINANLMTTDTAQTVSAIKSFDSESIFGGLTERIVAASVINGNIANIDYNGNPAKIYFLSPFSANNFSINIINVPLGTFQYRSINFTLIINAGTYKQRCSGLNINGSAVPLIYLGGAANIPSLASASYILQTFNIILTSVSGTVTTVFTSVSPIY